MKYGNSLTHSHMHTRTYAYIHTYTRKHTQASPKRSVKFHTYAMASWRCVSACLSLPLCPCLTFCLFFSLSAHKHWHLAQTDNARVWVRVCVSAHKSRQCFLPRNFSQVLRCLCSLALTLLLPPTLLSFWHPFGQFYCRNTDDADVLSVSRQIPQAAFYLFMSRELEIKTENGQG